MCITDYFDEFPRFKEEPHFCGLFECARGRKRSNEENTHFLAPPAQRAQLADSNLENITNQLPSSLDAPMAFSSQVTLEDLPPVQYQFF